MAGVQTSTESHQRTATEYFTRSHPFLLFILVCFIAVCLSCFSFPQNHMRPVIISDQSYKATFMCSTLSYFTLLSCFPQNLKFLHSELNVIINAYEKKKSSNCANGFDSTSAAYKSLSRACFNKLDVDLKEEQ